MWDIVVRLQKIFFCLVCITLCLLTSVHANSTIQYDGVTVLTGIRTTQIIFDSQGNKYMSGNFSGTNRNFNPFGLDLKTSNGGEDAFLTKYNSDGTYAWTKTWGGSGYDIVWTITVDPQNNLYVAGVFNGTNINLNPFGSDLKTSNGGNDVFLTKYTSDGTYAWTKTWGGSADDTAYTLHFDKADNLYIFGSFRGTNVNFNPLGSDLKTSNGGLDIYITKYTSDGTYAWTKTWGGTGNDYGGDMALDSYGNFYFNGSFRASNVNFNPLGSDLRTAVGVDDVFLTKYLADGTYAWTKTWGGTGYDFASSLEVDSNDNVYSLGYFESTNVNVNQDGSDLKSSNGYSDIFLQKYASDGTYAWTKTWGGPGEDFVWWAYDLKIAANDLVYVTGFFEATVDFDPGPGVVQRTASPVGTYKYDVYLSTFNTNGEFQWLKSFGGTNYEETTGVFTKDNLIFLSGVTSSSQINFNPDGQADTVSIPATSGFIVTYKYTEAATSTPIPVQPGDSPTNPNCKNGWKYCIQFGNQFTGLPSFINQNKDGNNVQIFIDKNTHHDDTYVKIEHKPIDSLISSDPNVPSIPFPWMQGYNIASPIWKFEIMSAFNGYTIPELDNPAIVILSYDTKMLTEVSPKKLRIGYYDTQAKRWKTLSNNTVLNETNKTIANTSKYFGYMAVVYERE
jgi:hypothetical protein